GTHLDITEQRHNEEVLRQKQKLESIGLLAGGIAHDFNNLLVGMLGGASYLRELIPPDHTGAPVVDLIEKSSEQAAHLTRQLLAYAGKGRHFLETLDIAEAVHDTCRIIRSSVPSNVTLSIESEGPRAAVRCDGGQLHQLVMNLVLNGVEAMD